MKDPEVDSIIGKMKPFGAYYTKEEALEDLLSESDDKLDYTRFIILEQVHRELVDE